MKKIKIANCRGKKPVINDICKALNLLANTEFEMNTCELKRILNDSRQAIAKILIEDNPKITIYK